MTEPTLNQKALEDKFLEQQYAALRTEVENASERAFRIFAASVLVVPTGLSLGAAAGSNVLPLIKMLLPLLLLAFYAMYWAQIFSTRRTGLYIESHIEPNLLHRTRGWESWLSDRRYAYDAQMNVAFFLLAVVYYLGTVCIAVTAKVEKSRALIRFTEFLNFDTDRPALLYTRPVPDEWMLFGLYALAGLAIVFLVQLLPDRQLKEEERLERVFTSKPVSATPEEMQYEFLKKLEALQKETYPNRYRRALQKIFRGAPFTSIATFPGFGDIKSYRCHTETFRHESKARHVRLTMKEVRRGFLTQGLIPAAVGILTWAGLLLWAIMPLQRLYMGPGGLRPTDALPVASALVLSLGALSLVLIALYYHFVGKNIGPKVDIRIRPDKQTPNSTKTLYIVQTSLALKKATLEGTPEAAWLKRMLEPEERGTLDKVQGVIGGRTMSNDHSSKDDIVRFDYEQALQSYQMMADIRFKLLALVPLVTGTGIAFLTIDPVEASRMIILAGSLFGFLITLGVTAYDQRNTQFMNVLRYRACELETSLPLTLKGHFHLNPDKSKLYGVTLGANVGLAIIYSTALAAWVFLIMRTALAFFLPWWEADVAATVVSLLVGLIFGKEFLRLDKRSKDCAQKLVHQNISTTS